MSKYIYEFTELKTIKTEKTVEKLIDEKPVKVVETVDEQIPFKFAVGKQTSKLGREAENYFNTVWSKCVSNGFPTAQMIAKKYLDSGGVFPEQTRQRIIDLAKEAAEVQAEIKKLQAENRGDDDAEVKRLFEKTMSLRRESWSYEMDQQAVFDRSAESTARNKTIFWWTLFLAKKYEKGEFKDFFDGSTFEEKLDKYDELQDSEDEFQKNVFTKLLKIVTIWYTLPADVKPTQENFDKILKDAEKPDDAT